MTQRHALGPSGASTGVQDESNIVGGRRRRGDSTGSVDHTHVALFVHLRGKHWNVAILRRGAHELGPYRRAKQNARVSITEEEMKLFVGIRRIQRRCSTRSEEHTSE